MPLPRYPALLLTVLLTACVTLDTPDLDELYADLAAGDKTPVIVIPGIMGSRLIEPDSGEEVWPGGLWNFVTGQRFEELTLPIGPSGPHRPALIPGEVFHDAWGRDFYRKLVDTLTGPGRYDCSPAVYATAANDCLLFSWDWRRDLTEAAAELDALIERLREARGDPNLKVDIIAHSAGGLVARYFIRHGGRDVLDRAHPAEIAVTPVSADRVRKVILIATPNYGSVSALQQAITGMPIGLATMAQETTATFPGFYQLLPNPERTWMVDLHGERLEMELFDPALWRDNRWSIFDPEVRARIRGRFADPHRAETHLQEFERFFARNLQRAKHFQQALSAPLSEEANLQYIVIGGDCRPTPARCLLEEVDGEVRVHLRPEEIVNPLPGVDYHRIMLAPGDGSVTKASLLARDTLDPDEPDRGFFPLHFALLLCEHHSRLPGNLTFRHNLLNMLLF